MKPNYHSVVLFVNEIDQAKQFYMDVRLTLLHDLLEEPWGQRTIRFYDPDNNLIEVGETLETFIRRYYDSGLSLQEVSERTTVPAGVVKQVLNL